MSLETSLVGGEGTDLTDKVRQGYVLFNGQLIIPRDRRGKRF